MHANSFIYHHVKSNKKHSSNVKFKHYIRKYDIIKGYSNSFEVYFYSIIFALCFSLVT